MLQVVIVMGSEKIHKPEDMLVTERRLFIISIQFVKSAQFGVGVKDSGKGKEPVDGVTVKSNSGGILDLGKEVLDPEVMIKALKDEITYIQECGFRSGIIREGKFFRKINFKRNEE